MAAGAGVVTTEQLVRDLTEELARVQAENTAIREATGIPNLGALLEEAYERGRQDGFRERDDDFILHGSKALPRGTIRA